MDAQTLAIILAVLLAVFAATIVALVALVVQLVRPRVILIPGPSPSEPPDATPMQPGPLRHPGRIG